MRPVTDRHKVSRAKLSYIIDATAAPVCIIAPISSWAAAVTSSVPSDSGINGFAVFLQTIPYNLYAILTLVMLLGVTLLRVDFGPMAMHERECNRRRSVYDDRDARMREMKRRSRKKMHMCWIWCFRSSC